MNTLGSFRYTIVNPRVIDLRDHPSLKLHFLIHARVHKPSLFCRLCQSRAYSNFCGHCGPNLGEFYVGEILYYNYEILYYNYVKFSKGFGHENYKVVWSVMDTGT